MKYSEFVSEIAQKTGLTKKDVDAVLDQVTATLGEVLNDHDTLAIPRLGKFSTKDRAARKGRNPATGEAIHIAAKTVVVFKAAPALKDNV